MGEWSTILKSLKRVSPETHAALEYTTDKNLLRSHPGLADSNIAWYGGKMTSYLNEVTKNDTSQYAIAMIDPEELAGIVGRADMEDPSVRDRVLSLYNRANQTENGLSSIVKLDGIVNEKGFVDVTRITPGSVETAEALRLLDQGRPPDVPAAKIPVLVQANGAKWGQDPAPRLRYNGKTSGTLSMPKWDATRPPPITKTVADARSPTFYLDQPKTANDVKAKLSAIYDPAGALTQGDVLKRLQSVAPIQEYGLRVRNQPPIPMQYVKEAEQYTRIRRERMQEFLNPLIEQYGREHVRRLAGPDNMLTMKLMGATGEEADDPIVLMRTERYGMTPFRKGEFSPSLSNPRETGMHVGEPTTARAFQGNSLYHDGELAKKILKTAKPGTQEHNEATFAMTRYNEKIESLKSNLSTYGAKVPKGKLEDLLFSAVREAKDKLIQDAKPGTRTSLAINRQGQELLMGALQERLSQYGVEPASIKQLAINLAEYVGITEGTGTTSKAFILRNVRRPLFLVDTGNFAPSNVLRQLAAMPEFADQAKQMLAKEHLLDDEAMSHQIQQLMERRGYDSAVYLNASSEGSVKRFAQEGIEKSKPEGYSPSFMIWKEDQIVPLDDPKAFPSRGELQLKKALALLVTSGAATKDKDNGSTN